MRARKGWLGRRLCLGVTGVRGRFARPGGRCSELPRGGRAGGRGERSGFLQGMWPRWCWRRRAFLPERVFRRGGPGWSIRSGGCLVVGCRLRLWRGRRGGLNVD